MSNKEKQAAFEALIKDHDLLIFKICRAYVNTRKTCRIFIRISFINFGSRMTVSGEAKLSTWLYKVCLYTALNNTKQKNLAVKHALNLQNEAQAIQEYDHTIDQKIAQLYHAIGFLTDVEKDHHFISGATAV
ncbi:hypothetical protein LWM68_40310 [Niabella sp. W65]|nr:hypothetical protein [Niabella sp. W65]MCH7368435.1 hypothetical protein [Niabella sp. W65]